MNKVIVANAEQLIDWYSDRIPALAKKLVPIYALLNWKWREDKVSPDRLAISCALHELVRHAITALREDGRTECDVSSGGLKVGWHVEGAGKGEYLHGIISFELSEETWCM